MNSLGSRVMCVSAVLCFSGLAVLARALRPDFTGTWVLDPALSAPSSDADVQRMELVVLHRHPQIGVTRTTTYDTGGNRLEYSCATDGKERRVTSEPARNAGEPKGAGEYDPGGDSPLFVKASWIGVALTFEFRIFDENNRPLMNVKEHWTLDHDGRKLTVESVRSNPAGKEARLVRVFMKAGTASR